MKNLLILFILLLAIPAKADTLVIYRPYQTETYSCNLVVAQGTLSRGTVDADCYYMEISMVEDEIFKTNFEGYNGGWTLNLDFDGRHITQIGCYLVLFSPDSAIISCQ